MSKKTGVVIQMKQGMNFICLSIKAAARAVAVWSACLALGVQPALAAVPANVVYQGTLRQSGGLANGAVPIEFKIWDAPVGGTQLWTSGAVAVTVSGGLFRRQLGIDNPASFAAINWAGITPYVEITVNGQLLTPREQLHSVPYALHAGSIPYVSPSAAGVYVTNNAIVSGNLTLPAGASRLGIGMTNPAFPLDVAGTARATAFSGDGSALTGVFGTDASRVLKAGDTMTGSLILSGASNLTVGGGNFSVASTVFAVAAGNVGVGLSNPATKLDVLDATSTVETRVRTTNAGSAARLRLSNVDRDLLLTNDDAADLASLDFGGASRLQFGTANQWFNSGNLGLGLTNPTTRLQVNGTVTATSFVGDGSGLTTVSGTDNTKVLKTGDAMTGQLTLYGSTLTVKGNNFSVGTSVFAVDAGNVGIGLSDPQVSLDILKPAGNVEAQVRTLGAGGLTTLRLTNLDRAFYIENNPVTDLLSMNYGNVNRLQFGLADQWFNSGNVGIGVTNPAQALHVNGTIAATSYLGDGSSLTGVVSTDITRVLKAGDTMTGTLNMSNVRVDLTGELGFIIGRSSITTAGGVFATSLSGAGSAITDLNASNVASGTLGDARLPGTMSAKTFTGLITAQAGIQANTPVTLLPVDTANEGGEVTLRGANNGVGPAWNNVVFDNSSGHARISLAAGKNLQVLTGGLSVASTMTVSGSGDSSFAGRLGIGMTNPADMLEVGGTGQGIFLNGATSNAVRWAAVGVNAPTFTTRSVGAKLVLYPQVNVTSVDYGFGIDGGTLWSAVPQANSTYFHKWYGGQTELMRLRADGRLGIGLTDPTYSVESAGEIGSRNANAFRARQAAYGVMLRNDNADFYLLTTANGDPDGTWNAYRPYRFNLATGDTYLNSTALYIRQSNGQIGLGTTNPTATLHLGSGGIRFPDGTLQVSAGLGSVGTVTNTIDLILQADSDANGTGEIQLRTGATDKITILNGGNVGVGLTNPVFNLHVNGAAKVCESNASGCGFELADDGDIVDLNDGYASMRFANGVRINSANGGGSAVIQLANSTGGNSFINTTGKVGIGTSSPGTTKLNVVDDDNIVTADIGQFFAANLTQGIGIGYNRIEAVGSNATQDVYILPKGAGGNVGVGAASAGAKLDVTGPASGTGITIRAAGGGDVVLNSGGSVFFEGNYDYTTGNYIRPIAANTQAFHTSGAERMRIEAGGDIGIGTTNPTVDLDVAGIINAGSSFRVGGTGVITAGGNDVYANIRVIRSQSSLADGMYINYGGTGGDARIYDGGTANAITVGSGATLTVPGAITASGGVNFPGSGRYNTSGNLGIGLTNPSTRLHLSNSAANTPKITIGNTAGGAGNQVGLDLLPFSGRTGGEAAHIYAIDDANSSAHLIFGTAATGSATAAVERVRIETTGDVGIGTTNPAFRLHVAGGDTRLAATAGQQGLFGLDRIVGLDDLRFYVDDAGTTQRAFIGSNGLSVGYADTNPGTANSVIVAGRVGIGVTTPVAPLHVSAALTPLATFTRTGVGPSGINLAESTIPSVWGIVNEADRFSIRVGGSAGTEVFTIENSGDVGIGVTNPAYQLELSLDGAAKPGTNTWLIASDRRLKKDIKPLANSLEKLMKLRGVTYYWKDPSTQGNLTGEQMGLIAQEVEEVFPTWVKEGKDGVKRLQVGGFEGLTANAVRELNDKVEAQAKELEALKAEIRALKK